MSRSISIRAGGIEVEGALNDSKTADAIWAALPITGRANRWGDEIYFAIPVKVAGENGKEVVDSGDLGYWPPGHAFCIFFGPTPASRGGEIRAASPVNVFGKVESDPAVLRNVKDGEEIVISAREPS
ncbi:MAG: cyclophilin-like fold protein [Bacillota bacterium]